jgi:hypothetical protein
MLPVSLDCFCFVFLRLGYPVLPVSLDCPFLIVSSVFSDVYLHSYAKRQPIKTLYEINAFSDFFVQFWSTCNKIVLDNFITTRSCVIEVTNCDQIYCLCYHDGNNLHDGCHPCNWN